MMIGCHLLLVQLGGLKGHLWLFRQAFFRKGWQPQEQQASGPRTTTAAIFQEQEQTAREGLRWQLAAAGLSSAVGVLQRC